MIIAIAAQNGGVGKSTTAATIAQALTYRGAKALLIDLDGQRSASITYGAKETGGSYDLITRAAGPLELIQKTPAGDIIPGNPKLYGLTVDLQDVPDYDYLLKKALQPIKGLYRHIVIDTPPGLGTCLVQALTAADLVVIPITRTEQAPTGVTRIYETIQEVRSLCNPHLKVGGVVITMKQGNAILSRQFEDLLRDQCRDMGIPFLDPGIRRGIAIQEAHATRRSLYDYAPTSKPAEDYMTLIENLKLIRRNK